MIFSTHCIVVAVHKILHIATLKPYSLMFVSDFISHLYKKKRL